MAKKNIIVWQKKIMCCCWHHIQTFQILTLRIIEEANKTFFIYDNKCEISNKIEIMGMWDVNTNKILIFIGLIL